MASTKRVTRFHCDYCRRGFWHRRKAEDHESHCFKNPDRIPWLGELSSARAEGDWVDFYEPCIGGKWLEWVELDEFPVWYPGSGKIWTGERWCDVPGYKRLPPQAGFASGGPDDEEWPVIETLTGEPIDLDRVPPSERVALLEFAFPFSFPEEPKEALQ